MPAEKSSSKTYELNMRMFVTVCSSLVPEYDFTKTMVIGFKMPDGRKARPVFCMALDDGDNYEEVTGEDALTKLGFRYVDYADHEFSEWQEPAETD